MKIGIIGSGHVGLVSGAGFADLGNEVICMDQDEQKISMLKRNKTPFFEPGLAEILKRNMTEGRLRFTTSMSEVVKKSQVIFLCVGTPPQATGEADVSAIAQVAKEIGRNLTGYRLIVEKSTVPVETGHQLYLMIKASQTKKVPFDVASNAEFLREGSALYDFFNPDRIVLGVNTDRARKLLLEIYKPFKAAIFVTDVTSGEMIKHASNSFLAMKISFMNLISRICEKAGADVTKVAEGMGSDRRIGKSFLNAGVGFGGSCFPKDLMAFMRIAEKLDVSSELLKAIWNVNEEQKTYFVNKVRSVLKNLRGKKLAVLGLAFKPDTDDMRNAPSIDIVSQLGLDGATIVAFDPQAMQSAKEYIKKIKYASNPYEACREADAMLILTEWREFRELDLKRLKRLLKSPIVIDGRNIYDPAVMKKNGFRYYSIGR